MAKGQLYIATLFVILHLCLAASNKNINYTCVSVSTTVCSSSYQFRVQGVYETKVLNFTFCS